MRALGGFFVLRTSPGPFPVPGAPSRPAPGQDPYPGSASASASAATSASHAPSAPADTPAPAHSLPTLALAYAAQPAHAHRDPLALRVRRVGAALGTAEPRVAASVAQQGLAARLWSAALGCAALCGSVPDLSPELLRWDPEGSAPDDLWLTRVSPLPADAPSLARIVLDGHLVPLNGALRARYGPAAGLLWGNAASALAGAARELDRWARSHGRADTAARTRTLATELLRDPRLAATGTLTLPAAPAAMAFRRRSCCLYYRVPGGGVCGDCCFTASAQPSVRLCREIPGQD
ncbi:MAG TPA: (2Fe-2S)-binding protein [Streptomyces sp.]|nr:(2Fe-2S)-binding protein [Streptomyces sp.]